MITNDDIRVALVHEYEFLCHECVEDGDMTIDEYIEHVNTLNRDELLRDACIDEFFSLEDFIEAYGD